MDRLSAVVREDEWEVYWAEVKAETEKRKERQRWQEKTRVRKRKAIKQKISNEVTSQFQGEISRLERMIGEQTERQG